MAVIKKFGLSIIILSFFFSLVGCVDPDFYNTPVVVDNRPIYKPTMYKNQPVVGTTYNSGTSYKPKYDWREKSSGDSSLLGKTIMIDPGHGGKDPGAGEVGFSKVPEKTIVLNIGLELARNLRKCGARVIMTRKNDTFIKLEDRAAMADRYKVDLFVSIHADSMPNKSSVHGPTVYIAKSASKKSRVAAMRINSAMRDWGFQPRGVRRADYKVLANHSRPAVLVECGYLTNWEEARRLNSSWYQKRIAKSLAEAICKL